MNYFEMHNIQLPSIEDADNSDNPTVVCKFTNGDWEWYVIGGNELSSGDIYLYCLVNGIEKELGMASLNEILNNGAVLDVTFKPIGVFDIFEDFDLRSLIGV